jgi:peptidoglycan/LPS O-acetylase OafA/YrhL
VIAKSFMRFAVIFGVIGMVMGIGMGASHDFSLAPTHAHINLVGWVTMFLAGLFYRTHPESEKPLGRLHLLLAVLGLFILATGIAGIAYNQSWGEPMAIGGSLLTLAAMLVFAFAVFRASNISESARF